MNCLGWLQATTFLFCIRSEKDSTSPPLKEETTAMTAKLGQPHWECMEHDVVEVDINEWDREQRLGTKNTAGSRRKLSK